VGLAGNVNQSQLIFGMNNKGAVRPEPGANHWSAKGKWSGEGAPSQV